MKLNFLILTPLLVVLMLCASCSKDVLFETEESDGGGNSTLVIKTRTNSSSGSNDAEESKVSYPVNVYVFGSDGKCVNVSTIETANTSVTLNLNEGTYNIYSIAGATADSYELPTKENAKAEFVVGLKEGKKHGDLMTSKNTVTLVDGGESTLNISLVRKVMLLQEVKISNVPSTIKTVSISIAPLYKDLCLNGTYKGTDASQTIALTREGDTKVWSNKTECYLLEASEANATMTISMIDKENHLKSYSYTCANELKANYKIKISGTYTSDAGVTLTGTLQGATWAGSKDINFNFDENSSSTTPGGDDDTPDVPPTPTDAPEVGTLYNGCYVLKSETSGSTTTVTLMTLKQARLSSTEEDYTVGNATSINNAIAEGITSLTTGMKITGWRLPTLVEIKYIKDNVSIINAKLSENKGAAIISTATGNAVYSYLCRNADGNIAKYGMGSKESIQSVSGVVYLRPVTTKTFQ